MAEFEIRFPHGAFRSLYRALLLDTSKEHFAILLAQREQIDDLVLFKVKTLRLSSELDIKSASLGHVSPRKDFIHRILSEVVERSDVDAIVDVHTHPFSRGGVAFSGIDTGDEIDFAKFLHDRLPELGYASIVLSQSDYSARVWVTEEKGKDKPKAYVSKIKCQTKAEVWPDAAIPLSVASREDIALSDRAPQPYDRLIRALGRDWITHYCNDLKIGLVGVGGLGSAIAENLVHVGVTNLTLIDPDTVDYTSLNRVVGARYSDAQGHVPKVEAVRRHLLEIAPECKIDCRTSEIQTVPERDVAALDWLVVSTDNHFSRWKTQQLALRFFQPFLSAGVNISVDQNTITDMSGEVILARTGDNVCLNCLGRVNLARMTVETEQGGTIAAETVRRGYVVGADIPQPSVKTLNSVIAALTVDRLINEVVGRNSAAPILVYDAFPSPSIYWDQGTQYGMGQGCYSCAVTDEIEYELPTEE